MPPGKREALSFWLGTAAPEMRRWVMSSSLMVGLLLWMRVGVEMSGDVYLVLILAVAVRGHDTIATALGVSDGIGTPKK